MGKDKKKKGKGAEKTAEKTEKKAKLKAKKELAAKGEDDIESLVKAIEEEERKRQEVKEITVDAPSHRSNFSMTVHPDNPEIVFFGGEFYNGKTTKMFNDLLVYNIKRSEWSQIKSPAGPPPRSAHQACIVSTGGGQLWVFGGEFTSPSESQFYHYKDLWCFHFTSRRWEKVAATGGPSARSGHRMVLFRKQIIVFGGFHDNLRDCKYFNDLHSFDLESRTWRKLSTSGPEPTARSACQMFPAPDGRGVVVFGGFCKEKVKKVEKGVTLVDMFLLSPDKHDTSGAKWRWQLVKQVGQRPSKRTGLSNTVGRDGRVFLFGGVMDLESAGDDDEEEDSDDEDGHFFNELYSLQVEGERATWSLLSLTGRKDPAAEKKKRRRDKEEEEGEETIEADCDAETDIRDLAIDSEAGKTVTVESGNFTISSTVGGESTELASGGSAGGESKAKDCFIPCGRFNSGLVYKSGQLYLFGGVVESGEKDITLKDFYHLDTGKFDSWNVIIENDAMEWLGNEAEEDEDSCDEADDDESDMDTD